MAPPLEDSFDRVVFVTISNNNVAAFVIATTSTFEKSIFEIRKRSTNHIMIIIVSNLLTRFRSIRHF